MTSALQNWYRKLSVFWHQAGSRENWCWSYLYVLRSARCPLHTTESGRSEVDSSVRKLPSLLLSLPCSTSEAVLFPVCFASSGASGVYVQQLGPESERQRVADYGVD